MSKSTVNVYLGSVKKKNTQKIRTEKSGNVHKGQTNMCKWKMNAFDITFLTGEALVSCNLAALTLPSVLDSDEPISPRIALTSAAVVDVFVSGIRLVDMGNPFDCGPVTSAKPRTCSNWAVFKKSLNCSWPMCTSPLYIKRSKLSTSSARMSRKMTIGCSHGLAFSSFLTIWNLKKKLTQNCRKYTRKLEQSRQYRHLNYLKYGLHALRTTLCAVNDRISQANVTSTKSSSSRKCRNDDKIELWKSFHFRAYCCSDGDGETARSIFVVVVLLFSVVCNKVDSVISLIANYFSL